MNAYRHTKDGRLDRTFLRVCAVYRLIKRCGMGRSDALSALIAGGMKKSDAHALLDLWGSCSLKGMKP